MQVLAHCSRNCDTTSEQLIYTAMQHVERCQQEEGSKAEEGWESTKGGQWGGVEVRGDQKEIKMRPGKTESEARISPEEGQRIGLSNLFARHFADGI